MKINKLFGYVEGQTRCADCDQLLKEEEAYWAMGRWWHKLKAACERNKEKNYGANI